jgi:sigma-B regulation protein RsbU (phosphoserine phosphatase)
MELGLFLGLLEKACLVIIIFYILTCTRLFDLIATKKLNATAQLAIAIIFGLLAIYGTYSGVYTSGAIANIRNLAPMIAGFIGGPWAGLGAGIIGGVHRFFIGGNTDLACALGTMLSGLGAGLMYKLLRGEIGIWKPVLFAFIMECVDMALILLIARPFEDAWKLVQIIALPMIIADTLGIALFAFMYKNLLKLKKAAV